MMEVAGERGAGNATVAHVVARSGVSRRTFYEMFADREDCLVADTAGVEDQGQISKLLRRLESLGLVINTGQGHSKGEPNRWALTTRGGEVEQAIRAQTDG